MTAKEYLKETGNSESLAGLLESYHQAKSKEEAVDITNKVETLIGYLELWYRRYSPPSGFFAVIEEAKEWLAAFGKEGEDETIISNIS